MKPHDLLFWIIIGVFIALIFILFANQVIFSMTQAMVNVKP